MQITPLFQQVRADFPEAEVVFFVSDNAAAVAANEPWLDRVVPIRARDVEPGVSNLGLWRMWREVVSHGPFDLFIHLGARWLHGLGVFLVAANVKAGFSTNIAWRPHAFDQVLHIPVEPLKDCCHASQRYLDLWNACTGFPDRGFGPQLRALGLKSEEIPGLPDRTYLSFAPGAGNWLNPADNKRWPHSHWRGLMQKALTAGYGVAVLGSAGDFPEDELPLGAVSLLGKCGLDRSAAVIRRSSGFVGHDSGLFHIALGVGVPAVAFFGPTREELTGPFRSPRSLVLRTELPCAPCCRPCCILPDAQARAVEGTPPCMHQISPEMAWAKIMPFFDP